LSGPKSMTGFGRATGAWRGGNVTIEVRSLNHRFLEVRLKLSHELAAIEALATEWARERMARGRIDVKASADGLVDPLFFPTLNMPLAKKYAELYSRLAEEIGAPATPDTALILSMRDVILMQEEHMDVVSEWEAIRPIFEAAFDELDNASKTEGEALVKDIKERLRHIAELNERIAQIHPEEVHAYRKRLAERISQLAEKPEVDPDRLAQELAFYAARSDFTEETVRMKAHIERFGEMLETSETVGRSLEFLTQEMLREVNTTSSKALSADISQMTVDIKAELEKIREQIQNIV